MQPYDLIVIGSGPGGYRAALLAKLRGLNVGIVEKSVWGGTCLNRGCVPKKDWHHTALLVSASRNAEARGLNGQLTGDLDRAWQHQHKTVNKIRDSYVDYMRRSGVHSWIGTARFIDAHTIDVEGEQLHARHFIIATGSHAHIPALFPLTPGRILSTDDLFDAPPPSGRRVALVGSGVIGTEFAFILSQLGCQILWLANTEPLSHTGFSDAARELLNESLDACTILRLPRPLNVRVNPDGVTLEFANAPAETVDWVLLGTGRLPHIAGLHPEAAGVEIGPDGFITIDASRRTTAENIYAIGDVANPRMTANHALADADLAIANIIEPHSRLLETNAIPEMVYSAIELGRIGLNEDEAIDAGYEPATGFASFDTNPRAVGQDEGNGFVRLIADMDTGQLLGAEIVGSEAGEIIHTVANHMGNDDALNRMAHAFYNHPARTEEIRNAVETLAAKWGLNEQVFGE